MKKNILFILLLSFILMGCNSGAPESVETETTISNLSLSTYENDYFLFKYDSSNFILDDSNPEIVSIQPVISDNGNHNSLFCMQVYNYSSYKIISAEEINTVKESQAKEICEGIFGEFIDTGVTIVTNNYSNENGYCMELSDGTKCYTKILTYGPKIIIAYCRTCPYSKSVNNLLYNTYKSASTTIADEFYPNSNKSIEMESEISTADTEQKNLQPIEEETRQSIPDDQEAMQPQAQGSVVESISSAEPQDQKTIEENTAQAEPQEQTVWISQTGSKYHSDPSCSGMKNPSQVTKSQAEGNGYEPCKKCY